MTDIVARMMALPDLTNEKAWETIYEGAREIERLRALLGEIASGLSVRNPFDIANEAIKGEPR